MWILETKLSTYLCHPCGSFHATNSSSRYEYVKREKIISKNDNWRCESEVLFKKKQQKTELVHQVMLISFAIFVQFNFACSLRFSWLRWCDNIRQNLVLVNFFSFLLPETKTLWKFALYLLVRSSYWIYSALTELFQLFSVFSLSVVHSLP